MAQGKYPFAFKLSIYFFFKSDLYIKNENTGLLFNEYDWKNANRDQHQIMGDVFRIPLIQMV